MSKLEFKAEVKKQLTLKGWDYSNLAKVTGYTQGSLQVMMSDDAKLSPRAMSKIAEALDIQYLIKGEETAEPQEEVS